MKQLVLVGVGLLIVGCLGCTNQDAATPDAATPPVLAESASPSSTEGYESMLSTKKSVGPLAEPGSELSRPLAGVELPAGTDNVFATCQPEQESGELVGEGLAEYELRDGTLNFGLEYRGLSGPVLMAHFHFGNDQTNGPIIQTICGMPPPDSKIGASKPAAGSPDCPVGASGEMSGTWIIDGENKLGKTKEEVLDALRQGDLYVNLHTCLNQPGEIRGQVVSLQ